MKKISLFLIMVLLFVSKAQAYNVLLLANNKEASSRQLTKKDISSSLRWSSRHQMEDSVLKQTSILVLQATMDKFEAQKSVCDLGLAALMAEEAKAQRLITENEELPSLLVFMRTKNLIDDIFFSIMKESSLVNTRMDEVKERRISSRSRQVDTSTDRDTNLEKLYAPVKSWPNEVSRCSIDTYGAMAKTLTWRNTKERDSKMQTMNLRALREEVITQETFNRLEVLREMKSLDWNHYTETYLEIINNAKDKLTSKREESAEHHFNETYVSRKEKITQRGRLYMLFDSTQVVILAQLIDKTAKRMNAKNSSINIHYNDPENNTEIYVFSPMEQYRMAIKMLRKEMAEIMRSDAFRGKGIEYEDLISAAYETGLIKANELDYVLKFEEFWNPKAPKWKTYTSFAFSIAGTASFYLPPPWNVIGAIGLVLTQGKIMNKGKKPDPDDNWNVII